MPSGRQAAARYFAGPECGVSSRTCPVTKSTPYRSCRVLWCIRTTRSWHESQLKKTGKYRSSGTPTPAVSTVRSDPDRTSLTTMSKQSMARRLVANARYRPSGLNGLLAVV